MHAPFQKCAAFNRNISKRPTCSKLSSFLLQMERLNISRLEFYVNIFWQKQEMGCLSGITAGENTPWACHIDILPHLSALCSPSTPPWERYHYGFHLFQWLRGLLLCRQAHSVGWDPWRGRGTYIASFRQTLRYSDGLGWKTQCVFLLRAESASKSGL